MTVSSAASLALSDEAALVTVTISAAPPLQPTSAPILKRDRASFVANRTPKIALKDLSNPPSKADGQSQAEEGTPLIAVMGTPLEPSSPIGQLHFRDELDTQKIENLVAVLSNSPQDDFPPNMLEVRNVEGRDGDEDQTLDDRVNLLARQDANGAGADAGDPDASRTRAGITAALSGLPPHSHASATLIVTAASSTTALAESATAVTAAPASASISGGFTLTSIASVTTTSGPNTIAVTPAVTIDVGGSTLSTVSRTVILSVFFPSGTTNATGIVNGTMPTVSQITIAGGAQLTVTLWALVACLVVALGSL